MQITAWLHTQCSPTVILDVHLSLSGWRARGLSASLWTSVYFLLYLSSWLQTQHPHHRTPPPRSSFHWTPAVNRFCLSLSKRPPQPSLSMTTHFPKLNTSNDKQTEKYYLSIHRICLLQASRRTLPSKFIPVNAVNSSIWV